MEYLGCGDMQKGGVRCFCYFIIFIFFSELVISYIMCPWSNQASVPMLSEMNELTIPYLTYIC